MENVFLLHPENRDFLRGKRRNFTSGANKIMLALMLLFCVVGVVLSVAGVFVYLGDQQLQQDGARTRAIVTDLAIEEDTDDTDYYSFYRFEVNGVEYTRRASLNREQYNDLEIGGGVDVIYLPDDPNTSRIVGEGDPIWLLIALGAGFTLFSLLSGMRVFSNIRADQRLGREGKVIKSAIKRITSREDSDNDFYIKVEFTVIDPVSGESVHGKDETIRNDLKNRLLPEVGTPLAILYLNPRMYRVL